MSTVLVLNGPNLGRLGTRDPAVYGSATLDDLRAQLVADAPELTVDLRQTDDEGVMLGWLHAAVWGRVRVAMASASRRFPALASVPRHSPSRPLNTSTPSPAFSRNTLPR